VTTPFYAPPDAFARGFVTLPPDEARHAVTVLRHAAGDEIVVIDGVGGRHRVTLAQVGRDAARGRVTATEREAGEPPYALTVACGLVKNRGRYETFLEKATELGARRVVPLQTARTEKQGLKQPRAENILLAATKQCGRSRLPTLDAPTPFAEALDALAPEADLMLLAHEAAAPRPLARAVADHRAAHGVPDRLVVWVGPEGGFTDAEVEAAAAAGAVVVTLGPRRLRAETAAIAATALVASVLEPAA
jgi:16S rRNA (uracil1498-N3)-methyltransferase